MTSAVEGRREVTIASFECSSELINALFKLITDVALEALQMLLKGLQALCTYYLPVQEVNPSAEAPVQPQAPPPEVPEVVESQVPAEPEAVERQYPMPVNIPPTQCCKFLFSILQRASGNRDINVLSPMLEILQHTVNLDNDVEAQIIPRVPGASLDTRIAQLLHIIDSAEKVAFEGVLWSQEGRACLFCLDDQEGNHRRYIMVSCAEGLARYSEGNWATAGLEALEAVLEEADHNNHWILERLRLPQEALEPVVQVRADSFPWAYHGSYYPQAET